MTTRTRTRTITLSDRAPISINESEWPQIASAWYRPGSSVNGTPVSDDETDRFTIRVRRHADGRAIVYGVTNAATAWTGTEDWRGGEVVPAGADIAAAILRVGSGMPDRVVRECIADLPPVVLDGTRWTYGGYWNVVLGATRNARGVVTEFQLVGEEELDEWLGQAESESWVQGRLGGPHPAEWDAFHAKALAELLAAVEAAD